MKVQSRLMSKARSTMGLRLMLYGLRMYMPANRDIVSHCQGWYAFKTQTFLGILIANSQTKLKDLVLLGRGFVLSIALLEALSLGGLASGRHWDSRHLEIQRHEAAFGQLVEHPW